jgi:uncharacterized ion transporter superfamily protein YfcC
VGALMPTEIVVLVLVVIVVAALVWRYPPGK